MPNCPKDGTPGTLITQNPLTGKCRYQCEKGHEFWGPCEGASNKARPEEKTFAQGYDKDDA